MSLTLTPYAGAPDLCDPALTGEWAAGMGTLVEQAQVPPWCSYLARRGDEPVGLGAFKSAPDADGVVEIAYLTFVEARGQGVATDVAGALVDIAAANGVRVARAHTLPDDNPSTRVLAANGFAKLGEVIDPEDGPVWRWERVLGLQNSVLPE